MRARAGMRPAESLIGGSINVMLTSVIAFTRSSSLLRVTTAVLAALAFAGCSSNATESTPSSSTGFPAEPVTTTLTKELVVELRTAPLQPPARGSSSAEITVHDAAGAARDGLTIKVTPWMPAHGHGMSSSSGPIVTALGGGIYRIDALNLPMAGLWELRFDVTGEAGFEDHATTTLDVH